jgi:hypothetical protein
MEGVMTARTIVLCIRRTRPGSFLLAALLAAACTPVSRAANLAFNFNADPGTPQAFIDGFTAAGNLWSGILQNDVTVEVNIGAASLPGGVLGQTTYTFAQQDYSAVTAALNASATSADDQSAYAHFQAGPNYGRLINHTTDNPNGANSPTPYVNSLSPVAVTRANGKVLGLIASGTDADGTIRLNSTMPWDFNPADGVSSGQFDFVGVAAHELAHLLGFASGINQLEQAGGTADSLPSSVLDLFRFSTDSRNAGVIDTTADTRPKYFSVNGGVASVAPFSTGAVYGDGKQADHWQDFSFTGLMDPQTFPGQLRRVTLKDMRAMDVIGYRIPEPGSMVLALLAALCVAASGRLRGIG